MITKNINNKNYFKWRRTPWDEKVFGKKTLEITEIVYENLVNLKKIFKEIYDLVEVEKIELVFFRYSSSDNDIKREAFINGFQIVEHSYHVKHSNISKLTQSGKRLSFRKVTPEDTDSVMSIVTDSFLHGRFHEDPNIDLELAKERYKQWILQLMKETDFFVLELKGEVGGFFNYVINNDIIDLPLSGLSRKYSGLGGFMWKDMFKIIDENEDVKQVEIMISASNLAVLNLYTSLNFKITDSLFGYHKHIRRN